VKGDGVDGDVWEGDAIRAFKFMQGLAGGKPVVFVLGNHEFWHRALPRERRKAINAAPQHGVTLLDNCAEDFGGVRFVGGTLWT